MLPWPRNWWSALTKLISGACAVHWVLWAAGLTIGEAVNWWSQKSESVVKTKTLSWTGDSDFCDHQSTAFPMVKPTAQSAPDDKVITKGDLSDAFRQATSSHLGDAKFLVKSDLDSAVKQLQVTQLVSLCVSLVGAWYISRK